MSAPSPASQCARAAARKNSRRVGADDPRAFSIPYLRQSVRHAARRSSETSTPVSVPWRPITSARQRLRARRAAEVEDVVARPRRERGDGGARRRVDAAQEAAPVRVAAGDLDVGRQRTFGQPRHRIARRAELRAERRRVEGCRSARAQPHVARHVGRLVVGRVHVVRREERRRTRVEMSLERQQPSGTASPTNSKLHRSRRRWRVADGDVGHRRRIVRLAASAKSAKRVRHRDASRCVSLRSPRDSPADRRFLLAGAVPDAPRGSVLEGRRCAPRWRRPAISSAPSTSATGRRARSLASVRLAPAAPTSSAERSLAHGVAAARSDARFAAMPIILEWWAWEILDDGRAAAAAGLGAEGEVHHF